MQTSVARAARPSDAPPRSDALVVLIVSGDPELRARAERVAASHGYRTITARHAGHAVLASLRERIDIIATELAMEEMSGPALASSLRKHHPSLAVVYFGHRGTRDCEGVLVRPFTGEDLLRALAAARASRTEPPTPSAA